MKFIKFEDSGELIPISRITSVRPGRQGTCIVNIISPELGFDRAYSVEKESDLLVIELFGNDFFEIVTLAMKKL